MGETGGQDQAFDKARGKRVKLNWRLVEIRYHICSGPLTNRLNSRMAWATHEYPCSRMAWAIREWSDPPRQLVNRSSSE